jgi:nicotinate-nucleotide pyrophosphorylase
MKYAVSIPFTGYCYIEVEADSEKQAIEAAYDKANIGDMDQVAEAEFTDHVTTGNVCYACLNDLSVEELKEEEKQ